MLESNLQMSPHVAMQSFRLSRVKLVQKDPPCDVSPRSPQSTADFLSCRPSSRLYQQLDKLLLLSKVIQAMCASARQALEKLVFSWDNIKLIPEVLALRLCAVDAVDEEQLKCPRAHHQLLLVKTSCPGSSPAWSQAHSNFDVGLFIMPHAVHSLL